MLFTELKNLIDFLRSRHKCFDATFYFIELKKIQNSIFDQENTF